MAFTLADLVAVPSLHLTVLAGEGALDHPIHWAHVSELVDPTPFLAGGELLMTVGLGLTGDVSAEDYIARLTAVGVVGLAFGVGLAHEDVPAGLVAAARRTNFPLLVVPSATPFIALSKTVSAKLAAEQYEELSRQFRLQQRLTQAAVGDDGAGGVLREVAGQLGGWALLLDAAGGVRSAHPARATSRGSALEPHLARLRSVTGPASVSLADTTEQVVLLPLSISRRVRGYLAVGTPERLAPGDRQLVNAAASLLTLLLEKATAARSTEGRFRSAVFRLLAQGDVATARPTAHDLWGGLPDEPVSVLVLAGSSEARTNITEIAEASSTAGERVFFAEVDDRLVLLTTSGGRARPRLLQALEGLDGVVAGESQPVPLADLARGHLQGEQALSAAARLGRPHTTFSDIGADGLLSLVSTPDGRAFAESLLRPILDYDTAGRAALIPSLRTWLEHNGHWDAAAAALGVHRHTLRSRMQRIEEILGRDLSGAGLRAELWTALQLLDESASG